MKPQPLIVAHRGFHSTASLPGGLPENSLAACLEAFSRGVGAVEIDVHASRDGVPFVIHDDNFKCACGIDAKVVDLDSSAIRSLRLLHQPGSVAESTHPVPEFEQLLGALPGWGTLLVEIKPDNAVDLVAKVISMLRARPSRREGLAIVQSFDRANLIFSTKLDPSIPTALLVETSVELTAAIEAKHGLINVRHDLLSADNVYAIHHFGGRVGAWTVNFPADIERVLALQVDTIITDEPILAMQLAGVEPSVDDSEVSRHAKG